MVVMQPQLSGTPALRHVSTIRSASARVWAIGFSVKMARAPHSTARQVKSARVAVLVHTATTSGRSARSISSAEVYTCWMP